MDEETFDRLKEKWKEDTAHLSSSKDRAMHPAYQRIIGGGDESLPHIIDDLREGPEHWFWALHSITGCDPIPDEHFGDIEKMAQDWIDWYDDRQ